MLIACCSMRGFIFIFLLARPLWATDPVSGLRECALEAVSQSVDPLRILRAPDPILTTVAKPLGDWFHSFWLNELILRMTRTLLESGGIGLAAPQVGQSSRIFLVRITEKHRERHPSMSPRPLTVVINPEIEALDPTLFAYREGCLSLPGQTGEVFRSRHIRLRYQDLWGRWRTEEIVGANAIVFQHEYDHLNGVLISSKWTNVQRVP